MYSKFATMLLALAISISTVIAVRPTAAAGVVGTGSATSCTEAALDAALGNGGNINFACGPNPHTIPLTGSKRISRNTRIDGNGLISLSGGNAREIIITEVGAALELLDITVRDTGPTPYDLGYTLYNLGTTTLIDVVFLNNNRKAVFNQGGTMQIVSSRFEGNTTSGAGAAISNESGGTLTVRDSLFINNKVRESQAGGAIYNGASDTGQPTTMTITRSTFRDNQSGEGGAVRNFGTMTIADSTFTANTAFASDGSIGGTGGAITTNTNAQLTVTNTTISGNTAKRGGGLVATGPQPGNAATLTNATLNNNRADEGSNLLLLGSASLTLRNTLIANPGGASVNCVDASGGAETYIDGGNNLQFPGTTCGTPLPSSDPQLSALDDNGGFTTTHALGADSPARNAANNANCPAFDQRGVLRPRDGTCDIGAVEYNAVPTLTSMSPTKARAGAPAFTLTVTGSNFIAGAKGSVVIVIGTALPTVLVSPTELRAAVPAGFIPAGTSGTVPVTVQTPVVDGGTSSPLNLQVESGYSVFLPLVQR